MWRLVLNTTTGTGLQGRGHCPSSCRRRFIMVVPATIATGVPIELSWWWYCCRDHTLLLYLSITSLAVSPPLDMNAPRVSSVCLRQYFWCSSSILSKDATTGLYCCWSLLSLMLAGSAKLCRSNILASLGVRTMRSVLHACCVVALLLLMQRLASWSDHGCQVCLA